LFFTPEKMTRVIMRREKGSSTMRKIFIYGVGAAFAALAALPLTANAQDDRTVSGAAIGAGTGAVIAGPPGAVVGGVIGAVVGGPRIVHHRSCWMDDYGDRHCHWN
jgi:osmotically inducible lipoprotein OsmB